VPDAPPETASGHDGPGQPPPGSAGLAVLTGPPLTPPSGRVTSAEDLPAFLDDVIARHASRTALITPAGRWTYRELGDQAAAAARVLASLGVQRGDRVAVMLPNGMPLLAFTFGLSRLGAVPVLIHVLQSPGDVADALQLTGARLLVMAQSVGSRRLIDSYLAAHHVPAPGQAAAGVGLISIREDGSPGDVRWWPEADGPGDPSARLPSVAVTPDDDAVVLFTSGTSGKPKAVLHRQRAPFAQLDPWLDAQQVTAGDVIFTAYPFCWSSGFVRGLGYLAIGATAVMVEHFEPEEVLGLLERERCSVVVLPGPHLEQRLLDAASFGNRDLSSVRRANATLARVLGTDTFTYAGYGMTETFTLCTSAQLAGRPAGSPGGWVGPALPGWSVRIVGIDSGRTLQRGEIGRIEVAGPAMMRGYLGRDRSEYMTGDGYFRTPDCAFAGEDDVLYFSGRLDDIVRVGGANVSSSEVEELLSKHPGVRTAVAFGVPHPLLGNAMVACVVPAVDGLGAEELQDWLQPQLASYKLPRLILIVPDGEVRFTVTQKVHRPSLRDFALRQIETRGLW
jgi:fatty-acyl-CoA synthase